MEDIAVKKTSKFWHLSPLKHSNPLSWSEFDGFNFVFKKFDWMKWVFFKFNNDLKNEWILVSDNWRSSLLQLRDWGIGAIEEAAEPQKCRRKEECLTNCVFSLRKFRFFGTLFRFQGALQSGHANPKTSRCPSRDLGSVPGWKKCGNKKRDSETLKRMTWQGWQGWQGDWI